MSFYKTNLFSSGSQNQRGTEAERELAVSGLVMLCFLYLTGPPQSFVLFNLMNLRDHESVFSTTRAKDIFNFVLNCKLINLQAWT